MKLMGRDYDEFTGMTTEYWSHGGKLTIRAFQDVEPYLEQNKRELNAQSSKGRLGIAEGLGVKVASIPPGVVSEFAAKGINLLTCNEQQWKRILNDISFSKLRTARGRI